MRPSDRIAKLEERVAELEAATKQGHKPRPRRIVQLAIAGLVLVLAIPSGVVLASHGFADVPDSHPHHRDIQVLLEKGITNGCRSGFYCPSDPVTRAQMAAFMNRLGALDGQEPKVNAAEVDGHDASDLVRANSVETSDQFALPWGEWHVYLQGEMEAPRNGFLLVTAHVTIHTGGIGNVTGRLDLATSRESCSDESMPARTSLSRVSDITLTHVFAVAPGSHTVKLVLIENSGGDPEVRTEYGEMSILFVPFDELGTVDAGDHCD